MPLFFREVNDAIVRLSLDSAAAYDGWVVLLCECGDGLCVEQLRVRVETYREARDVDGRAIVLRGHEPPGATTLFTHNGYAVIET